MKHLLTSILILTLCATASAQTIRTLGYNSTNGTVVANTGTNVLTFTNTIQVASIFPTNEYGTYIQLNNGTFYGNWECVGTWVFLNGFDFGTSTTAAQSRTNLGLPLPALTSTNTSNFQAAVFSATNTAPANTTNVAGWINVSVGSGTNVYKLPVYK